MSSVRPGPAAALADSLAELFDTLDSAVTVWNGELRCLYVNHAATVLLERPFEAFIGATAADVIGAERMASYAHELAAVKRGEVVETETHVTSSLGPRTRHVRVLPRRLPDGRVDGFIVLTDDITEERATRAALADLAASEAKFRVLADSLPVGMYHSDAQARNNYTNARWRETTGLTVAESEGFGWQQVIHPDDREAVLQRWSETAAKGLEFEQAVRFVRPSGEVRHVIARARPLLAPDGTITGYVGTNEDVTERLEAERAVERSEAALRMLHQQTQDRAAELEREQVARRQIEGQAAELARLAEERSDMLDLLAHEVRQPLNNASAALSSAGALLAQRGEVEASTRLERALNVLGHVQSHVENTLALSTLLAGAPKSPEEEADIGTILAVAVADLPPAERPRVHIERDTAARTAVMDSALVRLALRNLLDNAAQHTPAGTPITLTVSDGEAPLSLFIDVADAGGGLPAALLPRLFERGARVPHRDGRVSHGLGLFIAMRALRLQGGDLLLTRNGATGATWRLVLPQGRAG